MAAERSHRMLFLSRAPRPPLDAYVEAVWFCRQEPVAVTLERVLPTGRAQLIVNLREDETRLYDPDRSCRCVTTSGSVLSGVQTRYQVIDSGEQELVAGVSFRPGGCVPFMAVPAHETCGSDVPLADLWGRQATGLLRERLLACTSDEARLDILEHALADAWTGRELHPAVAFAVEHINRQPHTTSIAALTDAIGMSAKRFIERFKRDVGLTPKQYCRVRRFQRAIRRAHRGVDLDWPAVALDCGYYDQSHFIHDFRAFAGVTPTGYHSARTGFANHVKFFQSESSAL